MTTISGNRRLRRAVRRRLLPLVEPGRSGPARALPLLTWRLYALGMSGGRRVPRGRLRGNRRRAPERRDRADLARSHVLDQLLPFWAEHALDERHGGFTTCLDRGGQVYDTSKQAAMNARTVYAFALGHELDPDRGYLEIARKGAQFMEYGFWDRSFGGWYESVDPDGYPLTAQKMLFSQAYSIFGLVRYAQIAGDEMPLRQVLDAYDLAEAHAWDHTHGGYFAECRRDWTVGLARKTICVQLDFLKAVLALYDVTGEPRFQARVRQLADLVADRMRDRGRGPVLEHFRRDWLYDPISTRDVLEIGHCLKAARLLVQAHRVVGRPAYLAAAEEVLDFALRYAWDRRFGGFYHYVFRSGRLASSEKWWWSQCEGISTLLLMHRVGGDPVHLSLADELLDFCLTYFADPFFGEWYTTCAADGTPLDTRKGGHYKAAYHTVDACFDVVAHLGGDGLRREGRGVPAAA